MIILTPISELFTLPEEGRLLAGLSDSLELRPDLNLPSEHYKSVTHAHLSDPRLDVNLTWPDSAKRQISNYFDSRGTPSEAISFHLSRDYDGVAKNRAGQYVPAGDRVPEEKMVANAVRNCAWTRSEFGLNILLENNNYYATGAYDIVTRPDFISTVVYETNSDFLFDYAHAAVTAANLKVPISDYVGGLPMSKVGQLHVSEPTIGRRLAIDAHKLPSVRTVEKALAFIPPSRLPALPVTVEFYRSASELAALLTFLRVMRFRGLP